jgi:hypothetical protein
MAPRRFFQLVLLLVATVVPLAADAIIDASSQRATPRRHGPAVYAVGFDAGTSTTSFGLLSIGSGTFVPIVELPASGQGLGRDRQGHLYTVDTANNLVRINPANGLTKVVGPTGVTNPGPLGDTLVDVFASMRTGELFLMDYDNNLYSVDSKTGAATFVGATGIPPISSFRYSSSLAGNCRHLYFTITEVDENLNQVQGPSLYRIDPRTAVATLVGPTVDFMPGAGFVEDTLYGFRLDTRFIGGDPARAFSIDISSGEATPGAELNVSGIFGAVDLANKVGKPCRDH